MALSDTWLKEFEEAVKLSEDINGRLREREIIVSSGGDPSHLITATRRKITILGTCLDRLESLLQNPPEKSRLTDEDVYRRQDMLLGIRFKTKQMASSFSTSPSNRYMPNLGETTTKDSTTDLAKTVDTDSSVRLLPPKHAMTTQQHSAVDVVEEPSLHTRLLSTEREVPNPQTKEGEDAEPNKGCNAQLICLIILGILVLLLLVWTIIRIW